MRFFDGILFFLLGAVVGVIVYISWWERKSSYNPMPEEKQHILLERISKVAKLVTVEGEYTATNEYNDYFWANIGIFSKTMVINTKAKIFVGYDLKEATFAADSVKKVIRVSNLPKAKVLALEHDIDIPFKHEGLFSGFSSEELTAIGVVVKKRLKDSTVVAPLLEQAEKEGIATLDIIRVLVEQGGWTFEIVRDSTQKPMPTPPVAEKKDSALVAPRPLPASTDAYKKHPILGN